VEVGAHAANFPAGDGVLWSADRQTAWRLKDGGGAGSIPLEEARALAAALHLPVPR
jgi:hypothetical protein